MFRYLNLSNKVIAVVASSLLLQGGEVVHAESSMIFKAKQKILSFFRIPKFEITVDGKVVDTRLGLNQISQTIIGRSNEHAVIIKNVGDVDVTLSPLGLMGAPRSAVKVTENYLDGTELKPGKSVVAKFVTTATNSSTIFGLGYFKTDIPFLRYNLFLLESKAVTAPQLSVFENGVQIDSGSLMSFGQKSATDAPIKRELVLRNSGEAALNISSVLFFVNGYRLAANPPVSIPGGGEDKLTLVFDANQSGNYSGKVKISTNASDSPYELNLSGQVATTTASGSIRLIDLERFNDGMPSESYVIENNPDRNSRFVYLGSALLGEERLSKTVRIENTGTGLLTISSLKNIAEPDAFNKVDVLLYEKASPVPHSPRLQAVSTPLQIEPGTYRDFVVQAQSSVNWMHVGYIQVKSDDPANRELTFNVSGAVGSARGLWCSGDNNNWVAEDFSCASKVNGTICGSSEGKTKVCNHNQCVLLGDANADGLVDSSDIEGFFAEISGSRENLALDFDCNGDLNTVTDEVQAFASVLADASSNRAYNSRVVERCSHRDLSNDPNRGRALVFVDGAVDFAAMKAQAAGGIITKDTPLIYKAAQEVCLDNLGVYDLETGEFKNSNNGVLTGKYLETFAVTINNESVGMPRFDRVTRINNDFRTAYSGDSVVPQREAIVWNSETQLYYDITDYRNRFLNDGVIKSLKLPAELEKNLLNRQHRPDLDLGRAILKRKPEVDPSEKFQIDGIDLFPWFNSMEVALRTRGDVLDFASLPPMSQAFDTGFSVGDYGGLLAFWVLGTNKGFPGEFGFGENDGWKTNVLPALNDGISSWIAHRVTNESEVYKNSDYFSRMWAKDSACKEGKFACDKGQNIKNVMMFSDGKSGTFPFTFRGFNNTVSRYDGPVGSDLSALFFGGLLYDLAYDGGIGPDRTDRILWKTVSLIDNSTVFPMRAFGAKFLEAAQLLYPVADSDLNLFIIDAVIQVLTSRGIPVNGSVTIEESLPAPVLDRNGMAFKSAHPIAHPWSFDYGVSSIQQGSYQGNFAGDYSVLQMYLHSKLGPCDQFQISDGTFNSDGSYKNDGTFIFSFVDRELTNKFLILPGAQFNWQVIGKRCDTDLEGFYAEDVAPFGFRVVNAYQDAPYPKAKMNGKKLEIEFVESSVIPDSSYSMTISEIGGRTVEVAENHAQISLNSKNSVLRMQFTRQIGGVSAQAVTWTGKASELLNMVSIDCRSGVCIK